MIKPDLILHIGMPKTGTTTIQHFLRINHGILLQGGILYPQSGRTYEAHHQFAAAFQDVKYDWVPHAELEVILDHLQAEISQTDAKKIIISSEILTWIEHPEPLIKRLKQFFDFIRVVIILRRQDEWLESAYRHDLTIGDYDGPAEEFAEKTQNKLNYLNIIKSWQGSKDYVDIKITALNRHNRSIPLPQQFLSLCNLSWNERFQVNNDANITLNRDAIEFLRIGPDRRRISRYHGELRRILSLYSKENPDPPEFGHTLSPKQRRKILDDHLAANQEIASTYLPDGSPWLFDVTAIDDGEAWAPYPGLSNDKLIEITNFICRELISNNLDK